MSSWKQSVEIVTQELELARKKKQALDELLASGRVSRPTYEHLEGGLAGTIGDLEAQQRSLIDKMTDRVEELETQTGILESFLASLEVRHVASEVDQETYAKQREILVRGLEGTKDELSQIRNSLTRISG